MYHLEKYISNIVHLELHHPPKSARHSFRAAYERGFQGKAILFTYFQRNRWTPLGKWYLKGQQDKSAFLEYVEDTAKLIK